MEHEFAVLQNAYVSRSMKFGDEIYSYGVYEVDPHIVAICKTLGDANELISKLEDDHTEGTFYVKKAPCYK